MFLFKICMCFVLFSATRNKALLRLLEHRSYMIEITLSALAMMFNKIKVFIAII